MKRIILVIPVITIVLVGACTPTPTPVLPTATATVEPSALLELNNTPDPSDTLKPSDSPEPGDTPGPTLTLTPGPTPFSAPISLQDPFLEGPEILKVEERLYELLYREVGIPDGVFDEQAEAAVMVFQFYNGLPIDGIVDDTVRELISGDSAIGRDVVYGYPWYPFSAFPGKNLAAGINRCYTPAIEDLMFILHIWNLNNMTEEELERGDQNYLFSEYEFTNSVNHSFEVFLSSWWKNEGLIFWRSQKINPSPPFRYLYSRIPGVFC